MSDQLDFLAVSESASSSSLSGSPFAGSPKRKVSRDEMNLAEFPLSVLSTRVSPGKKTLEFQDSIYDRSGNQVTRQWVITAADKFGLPTSSDDEVMLGLLKLSVDCGLENRKVYFTRYDLLRTLRWSTEGRSYRRLCNALDRLSGVRIKATNSFYDNDAKTYSTRNFGIIDAYELNSGRAKSPKPSYFIWSEALFKSFRSGFIKKLDFDFFLELDSAVTKRLYRFLDKHFWYRSKLKMNLFTLAHEKIGVSRTYKYPSSIRQQIDPAADELIEKGFLQEVQYSGKGKYTEVTFIAAGENGTRSARKGSPSNGDTVKRESAKPQEVAAEQDQLTVDMLTSRGVYRKQAEKLVSALQGERDHERALAVLRHFDKLVAKKSSLVSQNPPGFLYSAINAPWEFELPEDSNLTNEDLSNEKGGEDTSASSAGASKTPEDKKERGFEIRYLTERKRALARLRDTVEPEALERIEAEVVSALENIKGLISESGFSETVAHGVEEKLAKLFAYPSFDEWRAQQ